MTSISWESAATLLKNGGVIAFPTDTVYGLACSPSSEQAVKKIYALKGRDFKKPLVLMCADLAAAQTLTGPWGSDVLDIAQRYWPGALTLILPRNERTVPDAVMAGGDRVGIRIPGNTALLTLLSSLPFPLAVTSANRSGEKELLSAKEVDILFGKELDGIVNDDTALQGGIPSTVVDVSTVPWKVLRQGPVKIERAAHG